MIRGARYSASYHCIPNPIACGQCSALASVGVVMVTWSVETGLFIDQHYHRRKEGCGLPDASPLLRCSV